MNHPPNTTKSISLIELLISIIIVTMIVLSFYSLETFSQGQVINSERRARVQNQLAYALEHMSKYVQQANGDRNNPPIKLYPDAGPYTGFQVRVDFRNPQIPSDPNNGAWVSYSITGNTLSTNCTPIGLGTCGLFASEDLSSKIIAGFAGNAILPDPLPDPPAAGFYVKIDPDSTNPPSINLVEIGLVGRYDTSNSSSLTNPQVEIKTKIICNNSSAN